MSMNRLSFSFFFYSLFFRLCLSLSPTYQACQLRSSGQSALAGCPDGTIYVSPTDSDAKFTTVQNAVDSIPQDGHYVILIGEGEYSESLSVKRAGPLTLLGQLDPATASVSGGNASQRNLVSVWNNLCTDDNLSDEQTATLTLFPHPDTPFGSTDFRAYNINFENRASNHPTSPALAISATLTNASFYGCTFAGLQDTWYTGYGSNTYTVDSIIYGETDYLFGCGTAWFQSVTLANRGCGGGITAWQGSAGTTQGIYISHSRIIRSPDTNASAMTSEQCYLGRPWNEYSTAVFLHTYMDDIIEQSGFTSWSGQSIPSTTYFAEFASYGPGGSTSGRVSQTHILSSTEAAKFTLHEVFGGSPQWVDTAYKH